MEAYWLTPVTSLNPFILGEDRLSPETIGQLWKGFGLTVGTIGLLTTGLPYCFVKLISAGG